MEKNGFEVIGRGWGEGYGGGVGVWGYPRGDRKFLGNFPMISGKFPEISWKFPGSRGMSLVTKSHILKR